MLNKNQLNQLSGFASDLSIVFFATVIAPIFASPQNVSYLMTATGLAVALAFIIMSMIILKD